VSITKLISGIVKLASAIFVAKIIFLFFEKSVKRSSCSLVEISEKIGNISYFERKFREFFNEKKMCPILSISLLPLVKINIFPIYFSLNSKVDIIESARSSVLAISFSFFGETIISIT
jgi:hypothetical protein